MEGSRWDMICGQENLAGEFRKAGQNFTMHWMHHPQSSQIQDGTLLRPGHPRSKLETTILGISMARLTCRVHSINVSN